jgi:hypothetical protein
MVSKKWRFRVPTSRSDKQTDDVILTLEKPYKAMPGFVKGDTPARETASFARVLASSFLKYTEEGKNLCETDSSNSLIALSQLHQDLSEQAQLFLNEEVPFLYEDQPVLPLLMNFALFRLKQVSRRFYFASLQNQSNTMLDDLKTIIQLRQAEYDQLLQAL